LNSVCYNYFHAD